MTAIDMRHPLVLLPPEPKTDPPNFMLMLCGVPLSQWDHPLLVSQAMSHKPARTPQDPPLHIEPYKIQHILTTRNLRRLEDLQEQLGQNTGRTLAVEIGGARFRRMLLSYNVFPINKLPAEILSRIFHITTEVPRSYPDRNIQRTRLASVCQYWREVAFEDKMLWSTLWFTGHPPWTSTFLAMERAGKAGLHVLIMDPQLQARNDAVARVPLTAVDVAQLMNKLFSRLPQIVSLSIQLETWDGIQQVCGWFALTREIPQKLKGVIVQLLPSEKRKPDIDAFDYLSLFKGRTPKLERLTIEGVGCDWGRIHCAELTRLHLSRLGVQHSPTAPDLRGVLARCRRLRFLILDSAGPYTELEADVAPIELSHLETLRISDYVAQAIAALTQFHAPNLKSLTLRRVRGEGSDLLDWLVRMRRFPVLQDLELDNLTFTNMLWSRHILVQWFDTMPRIRLLKMGGISLPVVFDALLQDPRFHRPEEPEEDAPPEVLCPILSTLAVKAQHVDWICAFIQGRAQLGVPFKSAYMSSSWLPHLTQEEKEQLVEAFPGPWFLFPRREVKKTEEEHEADALTYE